MIIRRFPPAQIELSNRWFGIVESEETWTDRGPVGEGESASIRVENQAGLLGIAKPGPSKASDQICRAAHEKLAFDLAHVLDLPVPPVVLWGKDSPGTYCRGRAISAWAFPQSMKWDQAVGHGTLSEASKNSAGPAVSAMRVFHTWISDTDRKSDHTQVNMDSQEGELGVGFIDHAYSMSYVWKAANHATGPCPSYMPVAEARDVMITIAERIGNLPADEIKRLVNRLPACYLPDAERGHILDNLLSRKGNLRTILGI